VKEMLSWEIRLRLMNHRSGERQKGKIGRESTLSAYFPLHAWGASKYDHSRIR
jgi:hypothetical protein